MRTIECFIPDKNGGRLFTSSRYPERNAAAHVESHVGIDKQGNKNIEEITPFYTKAGIRMLHPITKKAALFFISPGSDWE